MSWRQFVKNVHAVATMLSFVTYVCAGGYALGWWGNGNDDDLAFMLIFAFAAAIVSRLTDTSFDDRRCQ